MTLKLYIILGTCIFFFITFIALLIYWAIFAREYYENLERYRQMINKLPVEDQAALYNREFPTDFTESEINEWMKGDADDPDNS